MGWHVTDNIIDSVIEYLRQGYSIKKACDILGLTNHYRAIQSCLNKRGCYSNHSKMVKQNIKENNIDSIIAAYCNDKKTLSEIGKSFNVAPNTIADWLKEKDVSLRSMAESRKKHSLDSHYFDIIDSCSKSYILGFLAADGYITDKNGIGFTIKTDDAYILDFIKQEWKSDNEIKTFFRGDRSYSRFQVESKYLAERLKEIGIIPRKTYSFNPLDVLNTANILNHSALESSFLLGYFDGDGGIYHYIPTKEQRYYKNYNEMFSISVTGTYETCSFYKIKANDKGWLHQRHPERPVNNWTWSLGGRNRCKKFLSPLYDLKDEIGCYLIRKYNIYTLL